MGEDFMKDSMGEMLKSLTGLFEREFWHFSGSIRLMKTLDSRESVFLVAGIVHPGRDEGRGGYGW